MDTDCLIKLTSAQAKEIVCAAFAVVIPAGVKREAVEGGQGRPDALAIQRNLDAGRLAVGSAAAGDGPEGEDSALALYGQGGFDAICSDDRRFLAKLRALGVPYMTPAVLVLALVRAGRLSRQEAMARLSALAPFVSGEEYAVARLRLMAAAEGHGTP